MSVDTEKDPRKIADLLFSIANGLSFVESPQMQETKLQIYALGSDSEVNRDAITHKI